MEHSRALDLARRYHFILMDKICFNRKPPYFEIKRTFNLYEDMFKKLGFDKVKKNIIKCLEKLSIPDNWTHLTEKEINQLNKELELPNE